MEAAVSSADMMRFGFRCSSMQFKRRDRYGGPGLLRELFGISDACDVTDGPEDGQTIFDE